MSESNDAEGAESGQGAGCSAPESPTVCGQGDRAESESEPVSPPERFSPALSRASTDPQHSRPDPLAAPLVYLAVFCGGTLGTALRYGLALLFPGRMAASGLLSSVHVATFLVNMLASCGLAFLTAYLAQAVWMRKGASQLASQGLGAGLCGGLSTLSALMVEALASLRDGQIAGVALYLLLTFACGLLVTYVGSYLGTRLAAGRMGGEGVSPADGGVPPFPGRSNRGSSNPAVPIAPMESPDVGLEGPATGLPAVVPAKSSGAHGAEPAPAPAQAPSAAGRLPVAGPVRGEAR
ncbi:camphor resistance protein CrcB [Bifidobacterium aemilianum]|uniref:Fluoride-specific ion channel FluC n=1 Tax=Bifidobacterium aemilianum TaxID=2493120 RepID=A0A366K9A6_9BIFI|nr:CrcB family protein [Bifidobacterium aemilianum]RBP97822.1 camphor resistance protein CrcB [Bifidobacterium aemilianum]